MGKNRKTKNSKNNGQVEDVVWGIFSQTGSIAHYLLYKELDRNDGNHR